MEADDPRNEPSSRTKRQIPEKGIGKEEEKKRRKRGSGAKSRPEDGNDGEPSAEGQFGRLVSLNGKFESVVIPRTGLFMGRHSACHPTCRFPNNSFVSVRHCRLSVIQKGSLLGESQGKENNGMSSPAEAPDSKYGGDRNGKHSHVHPGHPVDYAVVVEDMSTNGTYLNDTLIGKGNKRRLTYGDHLSLVMPIANRPDDTTYDLMAYRYEH